jgi:hypothetical protein
LKFVDPSSPTTMTLDDSATTATTTAPEVSHGDDTVEYSAQHQHQTQHHSKRLKSDHHDSLFTDVQSAPPDPIFALAAACQRDTDPQKINLSIGAYRDEQGRPWVLPVVQKVR